MPGDVEALLLLEPVSENWTAKQRERGRLPRKPIWGGRGSKLIDWRCQSFVVGPKTVLVAGGIARRKVPEMRDPFLALVGLKDGSELWSLPLKAKAVKWGTAVDHRSRIVVSQENGVVACYAAADAGK